MSGDLSFENHLQLREFGELIDSLIPGALHEGGDVILVDAKAKVPVAPKKPGDGEPHLIDTGRVAPERGGDNTVGIEFTSVYARYIHENLQFKHIHGGQAKYLEAAMIEKQDDAIRAVADHLREGL